MKKLPSWDRTQIGRKKFFKWAVILLILVFLFTPLVPIQFFCLFFLFILAGSRFYSWYLIRNLRVIRMDEELRVFRHEWVRVEIKVENHGFLPAFMLVVGDLPGDLQVFKIRKSFCTLFRKSWTLLYWDGLCADRGVFSLGPAMLRCSDPLGLFPFSMTAKETTKLYVYPVMRSISLKNSKGVPLGNMISANPLFEDTTRYRSLRPYYQGDETRRINWKASAHVSGLLVNEYEATASYPLMIFLNMDQDAYPRRDRRVIMERTIEAAAALCLKASRERQPLGIIIYTSYMETGINVITPAAYTLVPILERLAAIDWVKPANNEDISPYQSAHNSMVTMLNQGKHLPYGTKYIYTGPDLGDEAYITLNLLKKYHLTPEYLVIDERSLPSLVPGNSPRHQIKESGYEIV
jgi:uncharacterized protein (DUF58 family)